MKRVIIMLLDSFGIGATPDADKFGDAGSNTLGHIADYFHSLHKNNGRKMPLNLPNLNKLGLGIAAKGASGRYPVGMDDNITPIGSYGYAKELSSGKDTPSGHWEIAGVPVLFDWGYFAEKQNSFPEPLLNEIVQKAGLLGYLGNCHASGTSILEELGSEHIQTGKPIFYTSADSVFQIACHEKYYGLEKLYELCEIVRTILNEGNYNIGRVIARPFIGEAGNYTRTGNRKDLAVPPPSMSVLEKLVTEKNGQVVSIGKIADIYANIGITKKVKANGLDPLFDATLQELEQTQGPNSIIFTNLVDFDSIYGHRRDILGYGEALEWFDRRLPELLNQLQKDDLLIITADHGCDPSWPGTDHTREHIPVLLYSPSLPSKNLGARESFADIGQTIAQIFKLSPMIYGKSLLTPTP
ncbi:phosphopentomutase [Thorsellia anophelis]|uniref:Phosphopentomutase n=1 Tax=Thorsellia anophelis DSM 18579 TaxID=1123402 RepID=A0A1I0A6Q9_9GAMM|nr:phosphopentomutase [Thorsellia anophelis]SES89865.1 phosphopentomutase [Thorsellia anophelis DSM 18579]